MIEVSELSAFVTVVRAGRFTTAARILGTQKAHLSRVVSRLEERLRVRLLQRSTRSLAVTEAGRELFERAVGILGALDATEGAMQDLHAEPRGTLRLTCGVEFGLLAVNRWVAGYLRRYPEVRVEADLTNRVVDLVHEGLDVAVRVGPLADSALSARKLGEIHYGFFASLAYLARREAPAAPTALPGHDLVMFTSASPTSAPKGWALFRGAERIDVSVEPRLFVNNDVAACDAVRAGLGIALLPRFQAAPLVLAGELAPVLAGWARTPAPVHAVSASSRFPSPKVRAFVDLARDAFSEMCRVAD